MVLLLLSRFKLCPTLCDPRLPRPWDSPGKSTGVGCHFLLQFMKVKSESEVAQLCLIFATPWTAAYQAPPSMGFSRQEYWSGVPLPSPSLEWSTQKKELCFSFVLWKKLFPLKVRLLKAWGIWVLTQPILNLLVWFSLKLHIYIFPECLLWRSKISMIGITAPIE